MPRLILACALALALPTTIAAQEREVPHAVASEAVALYNAPATLRVAGSLTIDSGRTVAGDVAVYRGPLTIAGHVTGRVAAINADLVLRPGARIDGDVIVVGGRVDGREGATLGGTVTAYARPVSVWEDGEQLALDTTPSFEDRWWERWRTRHSRNRAGFRLTTGGTYNRVEGLPIYFGPSVRRRTAWGDLTAEAFGIYRTAADFRWDSRNLGHTARGEIALGHDRVAAIGGQLFDVVTPVEDWQMSDFENGASSFLLHRDFRDHFDRHGGSVLARLAAGEHAELVLALSDQRWGARRDRDPWTLVRNGQPWRANPALDEGRFHLATASLRLDSRNDEIDPWAGWYLKADYERGTGGLARAGTRSDAVPAPPGRVTWHRGFLDVRRYSRLAPTAQINVRGVIGGTLGGDELPLERRLSLGGPGSLPGYDFRRDAREVLTCSADATDISPSRVPPGAPAECERVALAQIEYRSDFSVDIGGDWGERARLRVRHDGAWVLFANSGRGWRVGPRIGELQYRSGQLPKLSTFKTDIGTGIELHGLGVFVAKSVTDGDEPPNFFVRLRRRF